MLQIDPGEVGRNMRAVRVSKNIGRGRLAEKSDVALQSIRNYERGRSLPGLVNLVCQLRAGRQHGRVHWHERQIQHPAVNTRERLSPLSLCVWPFSRPHEIRRFAARECFITQSAAASLSRGAPDAVFPPSSAFSLVRTEPLSCAFTDGASG